MASNNRLRLDGLAELRAELRRLPKKLRDDAEVIVDNAAKGAAGEIRVGYEQHRSSGELADKVELITDLPGEGGAFAGAIVQNTSKLAYIFEHGTQARHNALGANRGSMPAAHIFIPAMIRWRATMYDNIRQMMRQAGLTVDG